MAEGHPPPAAVVVRAALDKPVSVDFKEPPLREVAAALAKGAGVSITVDTRAFTDVGFDHDLPVTFAVSGKPLAVVLDRILENIDLACDVRDEGLGPVRAEAAREARPSASGSSESAPARGQEVRSNRRLPRVRRPGRVSHSENSLKAISRILCCVFRRINGDIVQPITAFEVEE